MLTKAIRSFLYTEYNDDEDLQAFVRAFNQLAQNYVDTFVGINLPVYTSDPVGGGLLDWVAAGLYGMKRPTLSEQRLSLIGPFDTYGFNFNVAFDAVVEGNSGGGQAVFYTVNDDIFRRVITWHFYKGDGKQFNVRWLKRRIERFLDGENGAPLNPDQTYRVSVTFGPAGTVNIGITSSSYSLTGTGPFDTMAFNDVPAFDAADLNITALPPLPAATILKAAIDAGVLELPFQYTYVVTI